MEFGNNQEKEVIEQKCGQIHGFTGSVKDSWENVKVTLLDILNNDDQYLNSNNKCLSICLLNISEFDGERK